MSSVNLNPASSILFSQLSGTNNDPLLSANSSGNPTLLESTLAQEQQQDSALLTTLSRPRTSPGELFQQIQQAVTTALQSAQSNSSANPNQLVEQAIAGVVQQTLSGSASTSAYSSSSADIDGDGDSQTGTADSQTAFNQTLEANGISSQQFRSDFLAAIQQAQLSGSADPSTVFSSFPTGLSVDTAA